MVGGIVWLHIQSLVLLFFPPYRIREMRAGWDQPGQLVRFYIGLEDPLDLIADIEQALGMISRC